MASNDTETAAGESEPSAARRELPTISILIKALNEEAKIRKCIESAIQALDRLPNASEIILADSLSSDRTVAVALEYPIRIVQFLDVADRGAGAAVQLGYQYSRGDIVLLLDGDMELRPDFLEKALTKLSQEPRLAGVAGLLEETSIANEFDRRRVAIGASSRPQRCARWLNGGGLYRRIAIAQAGGYAADRNLKGWEEAELGMRLAAAGWSLERIDCPSTLHTGHAASTVAFLRSAWRSRRAMANGVLIRQSLGKPWMFDVLKLMRLPLLLIVMWFMGLLVLGIGMYSQRWTWTFGYGLLVVGCVLGLVCFKRGLTQALTTLGMWHYMAAALLLGFRDPTTSPLKRIESVELTSHATTSGALAPRPATPTLQVTGSALGLNRNAS